MFKSRVAHKRVEIYETTIVPDGFGGNLTSLGLVTTRWAVLEDMKANSLQNEAGITSFSDTYRFTFRYDKEFELNAKKHILRYGGKHYKIMDIKTDGFKHVQQIVIAKELLGLD